MAEPVIRSRNAPAVSIWPGWRRRAWMRWSNGASEPLGRFGRQRAGDESRLQQDFGLEQPCQGVGGRKLRAVEQGQAFLGPENERFQTCPGEGRIRRHAAGRRVDLAFADHRGGHVRQRRQVARRADAALARNDRDQVEPEHVLDALQGLTLHAGRTLRQRRHLQRQHQPTTGRGAGFADAGGVREHDVALKRRQVVVIDAHARQLAEAGIDAVDGLSLTKDALYPPLHFRRRQANTPDRASRLHRDRRRATGRGRHFPGFRIIGLPL